MLPLYTISTKPGTIAEQCKLGGSFSYSSAYQARPGMQLPVIIERENKTEIVMAKWGTKKPLISMDKILLNRPYNILIRKQRCAVPANCFFALKNDQPCLIRLLQYRMFLMGGLFHYAEGEFHFALLEAQPADVLQCMAGQMPVVMAPEKLSSWLKGTELDRVFHYADKAGSYWFDYFPVSKKILEHHRNDKDLLVPEGISREQMSEHERKLAAVAFEKERPNRSSMKH